MSAQGLGRLRILQVSTLLLAAIFVARLLQLQVVESARFRQVVADERVRVLTIDPPRGRILDRQGVPVAVNIPEFALAMIPGDLPAEPEAQRSALATIERATGIPYAELERRALGGRSAVDPLAPVVLQRRLSSTQAVALRAALAAVPGMQIEATPAREYAGGDLLAHLLGHVGSIAAEDVDGYTAAGYGLDAHVGQSGLELVYEDTLRGTPGKQVVRATAYGRTLSVLGEERPTPGADLVLSIDLALQQAARGAVATGIKRALADINIDKWRNPDSPREAGAALVLDVRTGEVLALASLPSFDANLLGSRRDDTELARVVEDPSRPLVDRTYMEVRSPGSIFKPLVAAAALQEHVARPDTTITSTGAISIRDQYRPDVYYVFRDWAALGTLNLYGGIARSSDVYFYYLAGGYAEGGRQLFDGLGVERIAKYARAAGLGAPTGIDLPGEAPGFVPDAAWKERAVGDPWVLGDTYTLGIGQGYLTTTPLQMAVMTAAIANGGDVLVPRTVTATRRGAVDAPTLRKAPRRLPVDPTNLEIVREAMRLAADPGGTAEGGEPSGIQIGGKTGTAEFGAIAPDGSFDAHGWYIGFAPYADPEVAVVVYLEHGVGATHAAPVARTIFEAYFRSRTTAQVANR